MEPDTQFLFFCTNIGNEKLLKEEIRIFYPELKLSYSRKGFLTYKNSGIQYDLNTISQLVLTFATRAGICLGKTSPENIKLEIEQLCINLKLDISKCIVHNFSVNTDFEFNANNTLKCEINEHAPINKVVLNIIALGEQEIWIGVHKVARSTTSSPNSRAQVEVPLDTPSSSYLKIAQIFKLFSINSTKSDSWLDFGCSPGGSTLFLLNQGFKVWGIDTAKMSSIITCNKSFTHIKKPVQDLSHEDLPYRDIHWIHVDLNLNPNQAIKEVLRLSKKYSARLKGIIFTVQVVKTDYIQNIEDFEEQFLSWGFSNVISRQVPSHKKEYIILAKR